MKTVAKHGVDEQHVHDADEVPLFWIVVGVVSIAMLVASAAGLHYHIMDYALLLLSLAILSRMAKVLISKRRITVDVPVDGVIVDGGSVFDTSYVTGEPEPVPLGKGDYVVSGYINKARLVRIRALKRPSESLLQLLIVEAEKALERKASLQRFIERFSQPYTLLVLGIFGLALLALSPYRALAILLAGCPSAFIISSSTATALSIALLARKSTVVRGGRALEELSRVKVMVFDKTGTITLGEMRITRVESFNGFSRDEVLLYAGGAAKASDHPVARVLAKHRLTPLSAEEYPGKGVKAVVDGAHVYLGSRKFLEEQGVDVSALDQSVCGDGEREVYVAVDGALAGIVCMEEEVSEKVRRVLDAIRRDGLKVVIASGDRVDRVKRIAEYLGVNEYFGELSPGDKRRLVIDLRDRYGKVAFVGDGINDVEALAEADVGIAVGSLCIVSNIGDVVLPRGTA
ncbi:heavy metal translocating P-type ATPase [Hyperthermus butylicus]|uniref:heavy metal translocating P-type ATPase n=1 Tax=Hyperthermus butylicus TaxID=54248 RepID=UPI001E45A71A|nr:HAD-IC family P-type ATPase [Hyperthermus butylicus]